MRQGSSAFVTSPENHDLKPAYVCALPAERSQDGGGGEELKFQLKQIITFPAVWDAAAKILEGLIGCQIMLEGSVMSGRE